MLKLGKIDEEKVTEVFLKKLYAQRDDADEYVFGSIKGEQLKTNVYHKPCGHAFVTRPYLFIQDNWVKRCPHCYPPKKQKLTLPDIRERIADASENRIELVRHRITYSGNQKMHYVHLRCLSCGEEFDRNFQNIQETLQCPNRDCDNGF